MGRFLAGGMTPCCRWRRRGGHPDADRISYPAWDWTARRCYRGAPVREGARWEPIIGVLLWFIVPAILAGEPPLLVAIVGAAAIMLVVLYLTHGPGTSTSVAVAGTLISLTLTGILSWVAVTATHLTGVADEDAGYLNMTTPIDMRGLLLAGILIGSLGVLDDVTVTQAYTVAELATANPGYRFGQLDRSATRIGRAHIASVINTIILAYAGASLPLLILITTSANPLEQILTNQLVANEIVRSIVGTIGLISAVPITTALAALAATRRTRRARPARRPRVDVPASGGWDPAQGADAPHPAALAESAPATSRHFPRQMADEHGDAGDAVTAEAPEPAP